MAPNVPSGDPTVTSRQFAASELQKPTNNTPQYPTTVEIPMQDIRRQNDVDRWRNKIRLQEKFEVNHKSILLK